LEEKTLNLGVTYMTTVMIGLEVHCQITSLKTKLFCSCSSDYRGKEPNTLLCPTCLGLPGALPVCNRIAVDQAIMVAVALNSVIAEETLFFRKNYFYPDMAKNFQISQYDKAGGVPVASGGCVTIDVEKMKKDVRITRIQLEEDPAKLYYAGSITSSPFALVDYNRAGIALLEIVTEPDLSSPKEARIFLKKIRAVLEHLGVSDGGLEGAMRCDANISIAGGTRVEVKNISSFKEVERALNFEILRQKKLMSKDRAVKRETRHWDELRRTTVSLRIKEEEEDYMYFPEPDLLSVTITKEKIDGVKGRMPELPEARQTRFVKEYGLPPYDAEVLTGDKALADFFEKCCAIYPQPKTVGNWIMGDLLRFTYEFDMEVSESKITPNNLVEMLGLIDKGIISGKIGKIILPEMVQTGKPPSQIMSEKKLAKISDIIGLGKVVEEVFKENKKAVNDAKTDEKAIHFLVGQLMRKTRGQADPELANQIVRRRLSEQASNK
jgi:aspartyl-tRNA(Asn)/glutamyl-tRNA(Gln) amidotransferase subunit B